jgi:hypothetical protein
LCDGGSSLAPLIVRDLLLRSAESAQSHDGAVERVTSAGWRREERGAWGTAAEKTTEGTTLTPWQRRSFYRNRGRVPVLDVAVTAVTFGRCPAPSRRCCFHLFDCRICPHRQCHFIGIIFIIIIVVAPFLSPFPLPPPHRSSSSRCLPRRRPLPPGTRARGLGRGCPPTSLLVMPRRTTAMATCAVSMMLIVYSTLTICPH